VPFVDTQTLKDLISLGEGGRLFVSCGQPLVAYVLGVVRFGVPEVPWLKSHVSLTLAPFFAADFISGGYG
jgi:hypothetical protein